MSRKATLVDKIQRKRKETKKRDRDLIRGENSEILLKLRAGGRVIADAEPRELLGGGSHRDHRSETTKNEDEREVMDGDQFRSESERSRNV